MFFLLKSILASTTLALISPTALAGHSEYCLDFPLSCTNTTVVPNLCCFNYPGGELLQTQFWDTDPATGPANHWTVHGLWYALYIPGAETRIGRLTI